MGGSDANIGKQLVVIVEGLASFQQELKELNSCKDSRVDKLDHITLKLADIAETLFNHWRMEDIPENTSPERENVNKFVNKTEDKNGRPARLCLDGINCAFGLRGKCVFFHPETCKNRELVNIS